MSRLAPFFPVETLEFFNNVLKSVMESRKEQNIRVNDFVDTLNDMMAKLETEEYKKLGITETTVMCQALIFFLAGKKRNMKQCNNAVKFRFICINTPTCHSRALICL